ncbi:MAG: TetR/AcrR family transcriptional regulator [Acidimicrobiia bacterium]|nr:TetR/AcrR family transcriptional regulator [Acidimicrobiia bacterium]
MGRPAKSDGRQTRAAVMRAALDLFAQKGYFGTSLRDIATAIGVRESALYNYFSSKEQLFEALIANASEERVEALAALTDAPITDARGLLERIVLSALEMFRRPSQEQLFRILMADGVRLTRSGRIDLMERLSAGWALGRDLMRRLTREGWLEPADPDILLMAFSGPLHVWRQLNAIGAEHPALNDPAAFARAHVAQFLHGAGARRLATRRVGDARRDLRRAPSRVAAVNRRSPSASRAPKRRRS